MKLAGIAALVTVLTITLALAAQSTSSRRYIKLPRTPAAGQGLPFSDGVLVGDTLYLSGRLGIDPQTGKPPADVEREVRYILDGMQATLKEAGMTMDDLVFVQVYSPELALYDKFNQVYRSYFKRDFPARAFIGSGPLLRGGRFEVQGIAVRR